MDTVTEVLYSALYHTLNLKTPVVRGQTMGPNFLPRPRVHDCIRVRVTLAVNTCSMLLFHTTIQDVPLATKHMPINILILVRE